MDPDQICFNHPNRKAFSLCHHCGKYYCSSCLKEGPEFYYCTRPECLKALEAEVHLLIPPAEPVKPVGSPPGELCFLALYPNTFEAQAVKTQLESQEVECVLVEATSGLIEKPFTVPVKIMVKETKKESQLLDQIKAAGLPEPVERAISYDEFKDAESAQTQLASSGIQSFLWDCLYPNGYRIGECFALLVRASDVEKATNLLIVPESE